VVAWSTKLLLIECASDGLEVQVKSLGEDMLVMVLLVQK